VVSYSKPEAEVMGAWMKSIFTQSTPLPEHERRIMPTIGEEIARLLAPLL
jgi:hypothetical protein